MEKFEIIRKGKTKRIYYVFNCENCGKRIEKRKDTYYSDAKKHNNKYLCRSCSAINFNGYENEKGYIIRYYKSFPKKYWNILEKMCKNNNQIAEHRAIMAIYINRPLKENEIVHHLNHNKKDNRIENLEIMSSGEHTHFHLMTLAEENKKLIKQLEELKKENTKLKEMFKNASS